MAATRRADTEEYIAATELARGVRVNVAEQVRASIIEMDQMAERSELTARIERLLFCERRIAEAQGRQQQARIEGLPIGPALRDEQEFRALKRETVMGLAIASALWCAAMDYEKAREAAADG